MLDVVALQYAEHPRRRFDGLGRVIHRHHFPSAEQLVVLTHKERHTRHADGQGHVGMDDVAAYHTFHRVHNQSRGHIDGDDALRILVDITHNTLVAARQRGGALGAEDAVNHGHILADVGHGKLHLGNLVHRILAAVVAHGLQHLLAHRCETLAADVEQYHRRLVPLHAQMARRRQSVGSAPLRPGKHHHPMFRHHRRDNLRGERFAHSINKLRFRHGALAQRKFVDLIYFVSGKYLHFAFLVDYSAKLRNFCQ